MRDVLSTFSRSATVAWEGDIPRGSGVAKAGSGAFETLVTFPLLRGEPHDTTTPEELLAASHAACYAIALRSVIKREGGMVARVDVTATVTAQKQAGRIRLTRVHLSGMVHDLIGLDGTGLDRCAEAAKTACTISNALAGNVDVTHEIGCAAFETSPGEPRSH